MQADINLNAWQVPPIFNLIKERGSVEEEEMYRVFNMGVGFVLIIDPSDLDGVLVDCPGSFVMGNIKLGDGEVHLIREEG